MSDPSEWLPFILLLCVVGFPAWVALGRNWQKYGSWLPYERRWPVPWGGMGAFLAVAFLVMSVAELLVEKPAVDEVLSNQTELTSRQFIEFSLVNSSTSLALVGFMGFFLMRMGGATLADLGLPATRERFVKDLGLGFLAALAALPVVYMAHTLLALLLNQPSEHPTLMQVLGDPNPLVLLAAALSAAVAAPVFEEFVFRLLFQGWLERVEDEALGVAGRLRIEEQQERVEPEVPAGSMAAEEALPDPDDPLASARSAPQLWKLRTRQGAPPLPPEITALGLPHGWGPILISSLVFAVIHLSQGPAAPIPLFILALMLGYLYQRTHRLTPSIAAHATFNLISLVMAWLAARGV